MEIRKASVQDLEQIMQVYDKARKFMRENGNAEQWGEDYPSAELIEHDIDKMYLCMSEGRIACVSYYAAEEDEDYKEINGKWLNEEPYGVVHRVASTGIVRGAASFCLDWAYAQTQNLRMDTYSDNIPLQKLLEKCGFQYCGSFERLGMDKWMAYQKNIIKQVPICFNCKRQMGTLRLLIAVVRGIHQKKSGLLQILNNLACYIYTACRSMGQGMGYTASVSNDIQAFVSAFQIFININFHIIELNLHTIEEGVVISCPGSDFIQSINHFNDSVKDTFRENKTQINRE